MHLEVISGISPGFPELSQSQGQVTHVLLTRSPLTPAPKHRDPFDLHVLSTPPAFVLSQDQTLQKRTKQTVPRRGPGRSVPTGVGTTNQPSTKQMASQTYRHTVEFSKNRHHVPGYFSESGEAFPFGDPYSIRSFGLLFCRYDDKAQIPKSHVITRIRNRLKRKRRDVPAGATAATWLRCSALGDIYLRYPGRDLTSTQSGLGCPRSG